MDKKVSRIYTKIITRCFGCRSAHAGYGSGIYHCAITGTELRDINTLPNDCPIPSFNLTEGDLREKISQIISKHQTDIKYTNAQGQASDATAKEILSLISPHLQAAADKEREIEQLKGEHSQIEKGFIGVVMDCYDRMERLEKEIEESKAEDIQQAVQQERERISESLIENGLLCVNEKCKMPRCKLIRQALEGKHE